LKHGPGKLKKNVGNGFNIYEGDFYYDKKQGVGTFVWASGNIYRGQYMDDEREG
jgi:hypothetical protein